MEIFNFLRISFEEWRNGSQDPIYKIYPLTFPVYPILSACWLLSPWILIPKNTPAVYFAIKTYDKYWTHKKDIDRACEPAFIVYKITGHTTFLHTIVDGIHTGNNKTFEKSSDRWLELLCQEKPYSEKKFLEIYQTMIFPLLILYHPNEPEFQKRIDTLLDRLYSPEMEPKILDQVKKLRFYETWKTKRGLFERNRKFLSNSDLLNQIEQEKELVKEKGTENLKELKEKERLKDR